MTEKKVLKASEVLALANSNGTSSQRSITVSRPLDQENDLGNLLGSEINEFTLNPNDLETDLKALARDNCQLIIFPPDNCFTAAVCSWDNCIMGHY